MKILIRGMFVLAVLTLALVLSNAMLEVLKKEIHQKNENRYSILLEPSRGSDVNFKRSPNDYFTVVKKVEKIGGLTRIAVWRSSDGFMFGVFWTESREPIVGEKVLLKSYLYNLSLASRQTVAFAYPDSRIPF